MQSAHNTTDVSGKKDIFDTSAAPVPLPELSNDLLPVQPFFRASLPLPPVGINHSYKPISTTHGPRTVHTPETVRYLADAALLLSQAERDHALINAIRASRRKVPLAVTLKFFFPTLWARDIDGCIKLVLDAVFGAMELNDNQVTRLVTTKQVDAHNARVEIEVTCALLTNRVSNK